MRKIQKCPACRKTKGGKRITLINAKFVHENCAEFLENRPNEISREMNYLYIKKNSLINKIKSIFSFNLENSTEFIEAKLTLLSHESQKIQNLRKKIYHFWPDYPPDWEERRQEALEKAEEQCEDCGESKDYYGFLHVHHIKFRGRGGNHKPSNLMVLCHNCHEEKHGGITFGDNKKTYRPSAYPERIKTIKKAIKLKKIVNFTYYKVKEKRFMKRKVKPHKLTKEILVDGKIKYIVDNLYLVGYCFLREDRRTFRLDRMKGLKIEK